MGRLAGGGGGWGVLISSQLFIPVSLHRGEQEKEEGERERGEGERDAERGGRKGGYCHCCLNAPLLPAECQHPPPHTHTHTPPSSAFDLPLCAAV